MKYTIELTNKQKTQMDCIIDIVHRYVGFNPKLEPIENSWESELEKHRKQAYDKGYADGKADAIYDTDLIDELKQTEYIRGLEDAWKLARKIEMLTCGEVKEIFGEKALTQFGDEEPSVFAILNQFTYWESESKFKAYEEKKKAEDESIKVGDVIYSEMTDSKAIIISFDAWDNWNCIDTCGTGFAIDNSKMEFWKKIGHMDEVSQLLDKLRGEEDEKN